jgi:hypothetical protein
MWAIMNALLLRADDVIEEPVLREYFRSTAHLRGAKLRHTDLTGSD